MTDYQEFDPCPIEEECVQTAWPNSHQAGMNEARVMANYIDRILREHGFENTRITVNTVQHDFGLYPEIRVYGHADLLIKAEDVWPLHWDLHALNMLDSMFIRQFRCTYKTFLEKKGELDERISENTDD